MPDEQVILDSNQLAAEHEFFSLGAVSVSTSGNLLAYSTDVAGDERFELRIKDLRSGSLYSDVLHNVFYGATWAGEEYLFYVRADEAWRPYQVWRHKVGTSEDADALVFQEDDARFGVGVGADRAQRYVYIVSSSPLTSEYRIAPLADPTVDFELLWPRRAGVEYHVDFAVVGGQETWLVTHNASGPNFAVSSVAVGQHEQVTDLRDADVIVPHAEDVRVEGTDVYRDFVFLMYRRGGISRLAVAPLAEGLDQFHELDFEEELYTVGLAGNPEWDAPVVRVSYTCLL